MWLQWKRFVVKSSSAVSWYRAIWGFNAGTLPTLPELPTSQWDQFLLTYFRVEKPPSKLQQVGGRRVEIRKKHEYTSRRGALVFNLPWHKRLVHQESIIKMSADLPGKSEQGLRSWSAKGAERKHKSSPISLPTSLVPFSIALTLTENDGSICNLRARGGSSNENTSIL